MPSMGETRLILCEIRRSRGILEVSPRPSNMWSWHSYARPELEVADLCVAYSIQVRYQVLPKPRTMLNHDEGDRYFLIRRLAAFAPR